MPGVREEVSQGREWLTMDIVKQDIIEKKIFLIRGLNVMLDKDLAELYGVKTKSLNLAVKRNIDRFPYDFMFQLTKEEFANLRFQFETSRWGGIRLMKKHNKGYKLLFFLVIFLGLAPVGVEAYQNPRYAIDASVDIAARVIRAKQKTTFVNNSDKSVEEVYFHIYPQTSLPKGEQEDKLQ